MKRRGHGTCPVLGLIPRNYNNIHIEYRRKDLDMAH